MNTDSDLIEESVSLGYIIHGRKGGQSMYEIFLYFSIKSRQQ